ncbi:MAG TPA: DUF2550 family protein [Actinomycetaceae bacterium]|nr:DUF2550 family protein [Actinomycetaceae bacterium]
MPWGWVTAAAVFLAFALLAIFLLRARWLNQKPDAFDCALAEPPRGQPRDGWAAYRGDELVWFPLAGLSWRPARRWRREEFDIRASARGISPRTGQVIRALSVAAHGMEFKIYVHDGSASGIRSWTESALPSPDPTERGPAANNAGQ